MKAVLEASRRQRSWINRFFGYFFWIALVSHMAWYLFGFSWPYYWTLLASFLCPPAVLLGTNRFSDGPANCLYGSGRKSISPQDKLTCEINKIRYFKTQRNFDKALILVNYVLDLYPNFPEALYLKAHVLWEGFRNPWAAESYFRRAIELTEDREPVHRWASSCLLGIYSKINQ